MLLRVVCMGVFRWGMDRTGSAPQMNFELLKHLELLENGAKFNANPSLRNFNPPKFCSDFASACLFKITDSLKHAVILMYMLHGLKVYCTLYNHKLH